MARESDILVKVGLRDENSSKVLKDLQSRIIRFVGAVTASVAAVKAITFPIREAANFERELKNVQKTTGFTDREISQLSGSLLDLSRQLGISGTELAQISAIAGQLGLGSAGRDAVAEFTGAVAEASVALGDTVEKTAEYTAQISSIFKIPIEDVRKITGVLNEVSNNSVANASQLADITKRIGDTAGLTLQQTVALAGYVRELGVPVEQAGTGIVNSFVNIQTKTSQVLELLDKDAEEWANTLRTDPVEAIKQVARAINNLEDQSQQAEVIKEIFGTGRQFALASKIVGDAVNDFAKLDQLLLKSTEEFEKGTSATKEYENIMKALTGQVQILRDSFGALVTEAGLGAIDPLVEATQKLVSALQSDAALDFAEAAANSLANLVSVAGDWVESITESKDTFISFLDTIETVGKFIATYFVSKVINNLVRRIARLITFVGRLGALFTGLFTGVNAKTLLASFGGVERQVTRTTASAKVMGTAFSTSLTKTESELVIITGLIRQLVAQLDALIIKLNASQILANRLAGTATAAIGAAGTAATASAFAGSSAAAAASGKVLFDVAQKTAPAMAKATRQSKGFLGALKGIGAFLAGGFLKALKGIPAFLAGPWSTAIITAVTVWQFFGDEIKEILQNSYNRIREFFGLQAIEFDESNKAAAEWSRKQREAVDDAITSYESALNRLRDNFPNLGTSVGDLVDDPEIRSDGEQTQRVFDQLVLKIRNLGEVLLTSEAALAANTQQLDYYEARLAETANSLNQLLRERDDYEAFLKLGTPVAGFEGDADEARAKIQKLDDQIAGLKVTQLNQQAVIKGLRANAEDYAKGLREVELATGNLGFQKNVSAYFDQQVLDFARGLRAVLQYQEGLKASAEALEQIGQQIEDAQGSDTKENLEDLLRAQEALKRNEQELTELYKSQKKANEELGNAIKAKSGNQLAYNALVNQGAKSLDSTIAILSQAEDDGLLRTADGLREAFKASETTLQAIARFGALKQLKEQIDEAASAMEYYGKAAQAALDNTNTEVAAVERKFRQFVTSLRFNQIDIDLDLKFSDQKLNEITDKFEDKRQDIIKKYQDIFSRALPSERSYWQLRLKNELKSLNSEEKREKNRVERKRIEEQIKRISEETARVFEEAASATNVNEAFALKAEGKKGLEQLQQVIREAQGLQSVDIFGNASQEFKPFEIAAMVEKVRKLTTESQFDIRDSNKSIVDATSAAQREFQSVSNSINKAFSESKGIVDNLRSLYPEIDSVIQAINTITLPQMLESSAGSLQQVATALQSVTQQGLGDAFDPSQIDTFLDKIEQGVGPKLLETITNTLDAAPVSVKVDPAGVAGPMAEATQQGIEQGSKAAQPNIDKELWQSRIGAAIGSKVYDTKGKLIIEDVEIAEQARLKLEAGLKGFGNIQANARGGFISGPGTSTSDSILSWLSNGEYVMDAFTTRFFGSNFFSDLQTFARSGRRPKMPGFAAGGMVGATAGGRDVVDLNLTIGGETASLFGEREQVRNLVSNLKRMTKGV